MWFRSKAPTWISVEELYQVRLYGTLSTITWVKVNYVSSPCTVALCDLAVIITGVTLCLIRNRIVILL